MRSFYLSGATAVRHSVPRLPLLAAAGLTLLVSGAARAADTITYQSAPLVMSGDRFGDLQIPANDDLYAGGLTDDGRIVFSAGTVGESRPELLLQWDGKTIQTIVAPASGPAGAYTGDVYWPKDVTIDRPIGINQQGDVVFSADHTGGYNAWGTFMWNAATQKVTATALKDTPATGNLAFVKPGGYGPAINNADEIAFVGQVKGPSGPNGWGLFFRAADGATRPVCLPGQWLPSTEEHARAATDQFFMPSLNGDGEIAFVARPQHSGRYNAYWWQSGQLEPLLLAGQTVEGGAKITNVAAAFINDHDGSGLVVATTDQGGSSHYGLYRVQHGMVLADAAPGAPMPGGGILKTIQYTYPGEVPLPSLSISAPNLDGQQAFLATLMDGSTAAYRLDPNGTLTLIFQATPPTQPLHIAAVTPSMPFVTGSRPVLNNHGQVALSVRVSGGHSLIMLLSPAQQ
jgi:hypothetical protein